MVSRRWSPGFSWLKPELQQMGRGWPFSAFPADINPGVFPIGGIKVECRISTDCGSDVTRINDTL
jgi:hypothetical protein